MKKLLILLCIILSVLTTNAEEWQVKADKNNSVKFISSTTLLDFEGHTNKIDGYIYWDGEKLLEGNNEFYFEVDLNSVKTGNGKRDRDMREEVLETDKWPTTYFKGIIVQHESASDGGDTKVKAAGKIFIHGVEKEIEVEGVINFDNSLMNIQTKFSVFLEDFKIEAPSLLAFIKVADEIKLELNFFLNKVQ